MVLTLRRIFKHSCFKMTTTIVPEKRNIEIKARIPDAEEFQKRICIAKRLTNNDGQILKQRDVFYKVSNGRLKLRMEVRFTLIFFFSKGFLFIFIIQFIIFQLYFSFTLKYF